ncbi:Protein NipSnap homolog 1 [Geodia barretti]|uniref:Protein NipSnap homolog 1 n=1 Tax=Geodia barretti TaxID=519541 RepID=A0AA35U0X1_GEOBA|nr:Protein NipSnap homolog 1 [Geodia barretti]
MSVVSQSSRAVRLLAPSLASLRERPGPRKTTGDAGEYSGRPSSLEERANPRAEHIPQLMENRDIPISLVGAWTTLLGKKTNTATHIWEYECFNDVAQSVEKMATDKSWQEFTRAGAKFLHSTCNQIVLPFTFFQSSTGETTPTQGGQRRVFEMRSYELKPGSMIEWGQEWAKGIQYRREEAVGGWFSQIGHMHSVHHLWVYKSLQDRDETRQSAWAFPGWDECVRRTVPLIHEMESSILLPTAYSPLQ